MTSLYMLWIFFLMLLLFAASYYYLTLYYLFYFSTGGDWKSEYLHYKRDYITTTGAHITY